jgi:choline dehydrogenase-like flavoprotein
MVYSLDGMLRSDLLQQFPLDAAGCLTAGRYLLPAVMLLQIFRRGRPRPENHVRLGHDGGLVVNFQAHQFSDVERGIIAALRSIGFLSHPRLVRRSAPGGSIHFAGTLPMRARPETAYQTDRDGRLFGTGRIFIGDSATFPTLPARNLTLTIMSNAMRVARGLFDRAGSLA